MKALVCCDEHGYLYNDKFYFYEYEHTLIKRYLNVYDSIRLVVRVRNLVVFDNNLTPLIDPRVEIFPISFFQGYKQYISSYFKIKKQIAMVVGECKVAIVRLPSTIGFSVIKQVENCKLPLALEIVANPKEISRQKNNLFIKFLYGIYDLQQKNACKKAVGIAYVTKYALQKDYPVVKNTCITTNYSSAKIDSSFYNGPRNLNLDKKEIIICHVSHPIKTLDKGHETVINIVASLNERGYGNVVAKFAGDGEYVQRFVDFAQSKQVLDKIEFVGSLSQSELISFLKKSDIMVFPTISEGLPRVLIEAMASGLPCVSTNVGGIPELLIADSMFRPTDVTGFANKIIELIENPIKYSEWSKFNFERSKEYEDTILQERRDEFYLAIKSKV